MNQQLDEAIIIVLDDTAPKGVRFLAVMVGIILIALTIAPFTLNSGKTQQDIDSSQMAIAVFDKQICQPSVELPSGTDSITHLVVPSWMRLCDWHVEPGHLPTIEGHSAPD